jgi:hypothetical protein
MHTLDTDSLHPDAGALHTIQSTRRAGNLICEDSTKRLLSADARKKRKTSVRKGPSRRWCCRICKLKGYAGQKPQVNTIKLAAYLPDPQSYHDPSVVMDQPALKIPHFTVISRHSHELPQSILPHGTRTLNQSFTICVTVQPGPDSNQLSEPANITASDSNSTSVMHYPASERFRSTRLPRHRL